MFLGARNKSKLCMIINGMTTTAMHSVKLLGLNIDWKLTFNSHVMSLSNKVNGKARALNRLCGKLNVDQKTLLYNSFIFTYYGYCPITWMFCGKSANNKAEQVQKGLYVLFITTILHLIQIYYKWVFINLSIEEI